MESKTMKTVTAAAVCIVLGIFATARPVLAEAPDTVSITFAMEIPFSPYYDDPTAVLSDFVGEDTVVIVIGALAEAGAVLHFDVNSPPCDGVEVKDTSWMLHADASIMNKGKPLSALVWTSDLLTPPAHYALVAEKITEVHACWLKFGPDGDAIAQQDWNGSTEAVFIIVTGEFRVTN
jgi:hypothetical protein